MPPTFTKPPTGGSFYFLEESFAGHGGNYCIAFLPKLKTANLSLTLAESWAIPGDYLFLNSSPEKLVQADLEIGIRQLLSASNNEQTDFFWIENPADPPALWLKTMKRLALEKSSGSSTATVRRVASLDFRNFALLIARNVRFQLHSDQNRFVLTKTAADSEEFQLETGGGLNQLKGIGETIAIAMEGEFAGCLRFDLTLRKPDGLEDAETRGRGDTGTENGASNSASLGYDELAALDIGLRLFFKDPESLPTETDFAIKSNRYPFLAEDAAALKHYDQSGLTLAVALDLINLLNEARTYFGLVNSDDVSNATTFPSGYRTNLGYTVHLTPRDRSCRLLFAEKPTNQQPGDFLPSLYLVPSGDFVMTVPRYPETIATTPPETTTTASPETIASSETIATASPETIATTPPETIATTPPEATTAASPETIMPTTPEATTPTPPETTTTASPETTSEPPPVFNDNLLCGLAGAEYIKLSSKQTNILCLRPGFAAFAPGFAPSGATEKPDDEGLTNLATTAWAYVQQVSGQQSHSPVYYAQPDQAVLYAPETGYTLLSYLEVPATALPQQVENTRLFPLLPYGGVQGESLAEYQQLEQQVLSPKRRSLITENADHTAPFPTSDRATGTTPQGLLATFAEGYTKLETLTLAIDTANKALQFSNIERESPLRAALQSNPLFLVISNPNRLKTYFSNAEHNRLTIQGWKFNLDPAAWRRDTVLIFKFHDQPLLDLLKNTEVWSQAGHFNTAPGNISELLVNVFEDAIAKDVDNAPTKDRENYGPLARIARTPAWSGILALNIKISPDDLPEDLKALAAGIDEDQFFAKYVGIESTPTEVIAGKLTAKQSSLFGLIDYQNQTVPIPNEDGYDFEVNSLRVLFQNSQVRAFSSEISITLDRLFDEPTRLLNSASDRNLVVLKGTAESHNGKTTYAFSFSGENHFALPNSLALNEVEIIKAQFSTDPATTTVTGRFTFWGRLDFKRLGSDDKPFDIFSFGSNPPPSPPTSPSPSPPPPSPSSPTPSPPPNERFLTFSNLVVTMSFPKGKPRQRVFAFDPSNLVCDIRRSKPRDDSVYAKFPLKFTGMLYSPGDKKIDDFGYMPVKAPFSGKLAPIFKITRQTLDSLTSKKVPDSVVEKLTSLKNQEFREEGKFVAAMTQAIGSTDATTHQTVILSSARRFLWYGLNFELELGSLGALAGKAGLVANLVVAWVPGAGKNIFVGLRLPGSTGGKKEITLQGVLKIVFKNIELIVGRNKGKISYLLKLKNIMLKFLVLSIPPNGRTEIIIFGDPNANGENNTVGWYAAYVKDQPPPTAPPPTTQPGLPPVRG